MAVVTRTEALTMRGVNSGTNLRSNTLCKRKDSGGDICVQLVDARSNGVEEVLDVVVGEGRNAEADWFCGEAGRSSGARGRGRSRSPSRRGKGRLSLVTASELPRHTVLGVLPVFGRVLERAGRASVATANAARNLLADAKVVGDD
jgi:hypothetical protein